jgi:hypothetical protein
MTIEELKAYIREKGKGYPSLRTELADLYELAIDEIDTGGSEQHECELAYNDIVELIKETDRANRQKIQDRKGGIHRQ